MSIEEHQENEYEFTIRTQVRLRGSGNKAEPKEITFKIDSDSEEDAVIKFENILHRLITKDEI